MLLAAYEARNEERPLGFLLARRFAVVKKQPRALVMKWPSHVLLYQVHGLFGGMRIDVAVIPSLVEVSYT